MDDELPGMLALAKGVAEQRWPHTMDAQVWAREWLKTLAENPSIATDEGTMIGWFANAIMAGYDTALGAGARQVSEPMKPAQEGTPRTDAVVFDRRVTTGDRDGWHSLLSHARQLECELASQAKRIEELERELAEVKRSMEFSGAMQGHGDPCHYCAEPCNALAGNPGEWPIPLSHADEPGKVKWHHIGCVSSRLFRLADAERELTEESARVESLHKIGYALQVRAEQAERALMWAKRSKDGYRAMLNMPPLTRDDTIRELEQAVQREHLRAEEAERDLAKEHIRTGNCWLNEDMPCDRLREATARAEQAESALERLSQQNVNLTRDWLESTALVEQLQGALRERTERCAKVCDEIGAKWRKRCAEDRDKDIESSILWSKYANITSGCAAAIRALDEP